MKGDHVRRAGGNVRRASYKHAVELVALNDSCGDSGALDLEAVSELMSVCFMADLFAVSPLRVARDVVLLRLKERQQEAHGEICATDPCESCAVRKLYIKRMTCSCGLVHDNPGNPGACFGARMPVR